MSYLIPKHTFWGVRIFFAIGYYINNFWKIAIIFSYKIFNILGGGSRTIHPFRKLGCACVNESGDNVNKIS